MALWAYDPFRITRRSIWDPFREMDHLMSQMMDDTRIAVPNMAGDLQIGKDDFTYKCNVAGFRPEELKVDIDNDNLVISADHQHSNKDESVHRSFVRKILIPEEVKKESIKCDIDDQGHLIIHGTKLAIEDQKKRNIPIGYKRADPAIEHK